MKLSRYSGAANLGKNCDSALNALASVEKLAWNIFICIFVCILLSAVYFGLVQKLWSVAGIFFLRSLFVSTSATIAASLIGYMLGFLFGIPRLLQRPTQKPGSQADAGTATQTQPGQLFTTNTSLEEISDWLTKIIIGLGLVQFRTIVLYLQTCAIYLASFASDLQVDIDAQIKTPSRDLAVAYYFSLIIACILLACLVGYLQTRTRLTLIFLDVEAVTRSGPDEIYQSTLSRRIVKDETGSSSTARPVGVREALTEDDRKLLKIPRDEMKSPTEIAAWATALARSGLNPQASEDALRDALQRDPTNPDVLMRLAEARRLNHNDQGYVNTVVALTKSNVQKSDIYGLVKAALLDALYLPPPTGYENALTLSAYIADIAGEDQPTVYVWRAAAFGQKYGLIPDKSSPEAVEARTGALDSVKEVINLAPDKNHVARQLLKTIFDPSLGGNPRDNDLEVFKDDKEFVRFIMGDGAS